ncbi:MAG: EcoRI family type II restriction endonuclease [Solirubrobacteraceae bacterium]
MARKADLRRQREGTVINLTSSKQETELGRALRTVEAKVQDEFEVLLDHRLSWVLSEIIEALKAEFPDVPFGEPGKRSSMKPDGGILSIVDRNGGLRPILISEVKNQGTNPERLAEGKPRQAQGNAIERLGKNVIGFRTAMLPAGIMPFICFGYGCDFTEGSSILDRVLTVAMFGPLNELCVVNQGEGGRFNRGSFFFREEPWTAEEMATEMYKVAQRSIHYYFAKLGPESFIPDAE